MDEKGIRSKVLVERPLLIRQAFGAQRPNDAVDFGGWNIHGKKRFLTLRDASLSIGLCFGNRPRIVSTEDHEFRQYRGSRHLIL